MFNFIALPIIGVFIAVIVVVAWTNGGKNGDAK